MWRLMSGRSDKRTQETSANLLLEKDWTTFQKLTVLQTQLLVRISNRSNYLRTKKTKRKSKSWTHTFNRLRRRNQQEKFTRKWWICRNFTWMRKSTFWWDWSNKSRQQHTKLATMIRMMMSSCTTSKSYRPNFKTWEALNNSSNHINCKPNEEEWSEFLYFNFILNLYVKIFFKKNDFWTHS